jgi:low temperature requirement protein LtrA
MAPQSPGVEPEKRVGPLELFFDLVFVFALTQVTGRISDDPSARGLLRGLLVLAAVWWAWAAYAWLTNEVDGRRGSVRLAIFVAMASMLLASLTIPGAFENDALPFALAYLGVRLTHIALFAAGTDNVDVRQAARALAPTAVIAPALLILGSALNDTAQVAIWVVALLLDYVGGALRGIEGWKLSPGHFAERHGLIVIIALGESIVAIGVGAQDTEIGAGEMVAAVLGVALTASLWWLYFGAATEEVEHVLHRASGRVRNVMARDAFSFLHLPLVAGIVLLALGIKKTLGGVDDHLKPVAAISLCGGTALYLTALAGFHWRTTGQWRGHRLLFAAVCTMLIAASAVPAVVLLAATATVCVALVVAESLAQRPNSHG